MNYISFNFDGTLADSKFAICEAMERACIRNGVSYVGDDELIQQMGKDLNHLIRSSSVEQMDDETFVAVARSYRETFRFNLVNMVDGMRRVLELCHDAGDVIAVCSGRHEKSLLSLIEQFEIKDMLSAIVAGDKVSEPKPNQAMLWEVAKEIQCNPRELIVVGDSMWDMEMAKASGAFAIGVTWGVHDEAQLRSEGADVVCNSPLALANHFNFAAV